MLSSFIGMILGVTAGISTPDVVHTVYAEEPRKTVLIEISYTQEGIERRIEEEFRDAPIMLKVARCESSLKADAYNPKNNSHDRGIFQISEKYHGEEMKELGIDPTDVADNIKYARILYDRNGTKDWTASKECWNK